MARKKLREAFGEGISDEQGRPVTFEDLVYGLDIEWRGTKWRKERLAYFEKKCAVKEAAGLLGVHPNTLRKWITEGKIEYSQEAPHTTIYIPEREINRLKDKSGFKSSE